MAGFLYSYQLRLLQSLFGPAMFLSSLLGYVFLPSEQWWLVFSNLGLSLLLLSTSGTTNWRHGLRRLLDNDNYIFAIPLIIVAAPDKSLGWLVNILIISWIAVRALWLEKFSIKRN